MNDRDTITLPREVVEKAVKAFENGCPPTCENGMIDSGGFLPWGEPMLDLCPACLAFEHLRTALAAETPKHPGYIIGSHWLETAYSRICAGEAEEEVLRDCGWRRCAVGQGLTQHCSEAEALRRDAFRKGFYAGFAATGEGWNGEYPFQDKNRPIAGDPSVEAAIDAAMGDKR